MASALKRSINSLDTSLGRWGVFIAVMTALVGIGLILECLYEIPEAIKERREKKTWKPLLIIAGVVLITVGVLGEFVGEYEAGNKETRLRTANGEIDYALGQEVENAQTNAKGAANAGGEAQSSADQAKTDAGPAKSLADDAEGKAKGVARQTSALEKRADALDGKIRQAKAFADLAFARTRRRAYRLDGDKFLMKLRGVRPFDVEVL